MWRARHTGLGGDCSGSGRDGRVVGQRRDGLNKMMGWTPTTAKGTEPGLSPLCRGQPMELSQVAMGDYRGWVLPFPTACWEQLETVKLCQSLWVTEPCCR